MLAVGTIPITVPGTNRGASTLRKVVVCFGVRVLHARRNELVSEGQRHQGADLRHRDSAGSPHSAEPTTCEEQILWHREL